MLLAELSVHGPTPCVKCGMTCDLTESRFRAVGGAEETGREEWAQELIDIWLEVQVRGKGGQ